MKVAQLRDVLRAGEKLHKEAGDSEAAHALAEFSNLLDGIESGTVADLVKRIEKARKQMQPAARVARQRRGSKKKGG